MACYPWIIPERQGQDIDDFPNLKRWQAAIRARPATQRAYAKAKEVNPGQGGIRTEEEKRILFGQDRSVVK
jgi:GST-like protein